MARTLTQARKQPAYQSPQPYAATTSSLPMVAVEGSIPTGTAQSHAGKYTVKSGETLMMITRTFDCDLSRLISQNNLSPPDYVIRPGQEIKLAGCKK